jgi:hypothetical protein
VGAVRVADGSRPVLHLLTTSPVALACRGLCRGDRLACRPDAAVRSREAGGPSIRVAARRAMVSGARGRRRGGGSSDRCNGHAWPLDSPGLDRGRVRVASTQPALCINRCVRGGPGSLSGTQGATFAYAMALRIKPRNGPFNEQFLGIQAGRPVATDRLVTPFNAFKAQSGPREVSPMNFTRGSRSIQRLMTARPSDFGSRGRA